MAEYSMLAMVTAAVVYLFAVIAHAAEWAAARNAVTTVERRRRRILVGPGGVNEPVDVPEAAIPAPEVESRETDADRLRTDKWGRIGIALTVVGLASHVFAVVGRGIAAGRWPWGNMYEFTSSSLVFVVAVYLVLATRFRMRWLGLPVTMIASIGLGLAVTVFYVEVGPLVPALHSAWFLFHILAATVACAAFTIGGIASILYLVQQRAEADGVVHGYLAKAPSSEAMDRLAYRTLAFAFPLFTFVIAAGAIWAQYAWGRYWGWDPKETWSLITWAIYAAYLHARATAGWKGRRAAVIAIIGMVSFWWNFVGVNLFVQGLHSYAK
ncbi:c-type cytochrome biogenesis protein CcsB [Mariniluteicoccus flavus]